MTRLFAQPYDITATGFYFDSAEEFAQKAAALLNDTGQPAEEFEIQFIDGERIDAELFQALGIKQVTVTAFFACLEQWCEYEKQRVIVAAGCCGSGFDLATDSPDDIDVDLYHVEDLRELAEQFVDEGLFGNVTENIQCYLDYDAIARDLGMDYSETTVAGQRLVYRCC